MSLRIIAPAAPGEVRARAADSSTPVDHYMERLVKLVPAESIAAYPLLHSLAVDQGNWAIFLVSWVLLVVSIILRWHATSVEGQGAQTTAVIIAAVSFFIWVYVMGGDFGLVALLQKMELLDPGSDFVSEVNFLAVMALVIWTILVPVFYKGDSS